MNSYTKLFTSILDSSIWAENDQTRLVWITMLAMADQHGEVQASVPGLARRAGVSIEAATAAIERLLSPDPHSRTPDHEGRRIAKIDGGWEILNHGKYRRMASLEDRKEKAANRQRRHRERVKGARDGQPESVTERDMSRFSVTRNAQQGVSHAAVTHLPDKAEAEAEAEAKTDQKGARSTSSKPDNQELAIESEWHLAYGVELPESLRTPECLQSARLWLQHKKEKRSAYKPTGLQVAVSKWAKEYTPAQFNAAVAESIAHNYQGLFPAKADCQPQNGGARANKPTDPNDWRNDPNDWRHSL